MNLTSIFISYKHIVLQDLLLMWIFFYKNTYKSFEIIIKTLETRAESRDKKVSDNAKTLLTNILSIKSVGTLLGCIDIYRVIAIASCDLQTVEKIPWEVLSNLNSVITKLEKMSQTLKTVSSDGNENVLSEPTIVVNQDEWPHLAKHLGDLKLGKFKNLVVGSGSKQTYNPVQVSGQAYSS